MDEKKYFVSDDIFKSNFFSKSQKIATVEVDLPTSTNEIDFPVSIEFSKNNINPNSHVMLININENNKTLVGGCGAVSCFSILFRRSRLHPEKMD